MSYQSAKKKKVLQPSYDEGPDESEEIASTVASSVACHEDIDENDVVHVSSFELNYFELLCA